MYKILFCSKQYKETPLYLRKFLPEDKYFIKNCSIDDLSEEIEDAHVAVPLMSKITKDIIFKGNNLKLIQQFGVGLEGVDVSSATGKKVYVANVPAHNTGNAYSVAEMTLFFILALLKNYKESQQYFQNRVIGYPLGDTLIDKKILILGYGNLGKAIANLLNKLNLNITIAKRNILNNENPDYKFIKLSEVINYVENFDFLIIALPLNNDTKNFVNEDFIVKMNRNSFLINVARGGVVKYEALLNALKNSQIKGAAMDVYWEEPFNPNDEILKYNVVYTPHIAGSTYYSYNLISKKMAENIKKVIEKGIPPDNWANPF
jgi:lactate dehydrogenase-like 2-hydroxyacid dehydrogenase